MYINPFWCGVIFTILFEFIAFVAYAIYVAHKRK